MSLLPSPLLATSVEAAAEALGDYDDLRCPICFALMLSPRMLPGCTGRHSFCAQCIAFWLQSQRDAGITQSCPIDRRPLGPDEHPIIDYYVATSVEELVVCCPNRSLGCKASFALRDGSAHLATECQYRTVQCPSCLKPTSAAALPRHVKICFKHCEGCSIAVPRSDLFQHESALCLTKPHVPWWLASQATAFTVFRTSVTDKFGWLLATPARIADWEAAGASLSALCEAYSATEGASERSSSYCLRVAAECRRRGWLGPSVALSSRAAELEPASLDAALVHANSLLESGDCTGIER